MSRSVSEVKEIFGISSLVGHYDLKKPVRVAVDASSFGLGAMLSRLSEDGEEKVIAFASRTLSQSEQNYSVIERDA